MKEVTVRSTWRATSVIEVPDDFVVTQDINEWPEDLLEQVDSSGAELVDWEMIER